jgi:PleD family two-component response regulator
VTDEDKNSSSSSECEIGPVKKVTSEVFFAGFDLAVPRRNQTNVSLPLSHKDRRILIVDDEPYNLMALKVVIDAADKRVKDMIDEVTNGLEAFEAVKKAN